MKCILTVRLFQTVMYADIHWCRQTVGNKFHIGVIQH